jgi:TetR/AcrR family transcriptional regulator, tetracycline repressor protein
MRRLGQALDRKVMTLYRYVPSKDALLDGVVARVLTDLAINPAAADWRQELRDLRPSPGVGTAACTEDSRRRHIEVIQGG